MVFVTPFDSHYIVFLCGGFKTVKN